MIIRTNQNAEFDLIHLQQKRDNGFPSFWIIFKFFAIVLVFAYGPYCHLVESKQGEKNRWKRNKETVMLADILRAIFVWPWKIVSVSVRYLFYQPMDEKIKTWTLRFPAKENPNMEKALFDWPIVLQYDVKAKYRLISRKFFGHWVFSAERSFNQPKATRVCIRSLNQSNRSISVRLFFVCFVRSFSFQGHTKIALSLFNCFIIRKSKLHFSREALKSSLEHHCPFQIWTLKCCRLAFWISG